MRLDMIIAVARIEPGFKNLDLNSAVLSSFESTDEFLGLAAKHRAANDLDSPLHQRFVHDPIGLSDQAVPRKRERLQEWFKVY